MLQPIRAGSRVGIDERENFRFVRSVQNGFAQVVNLLAFSVGFSRND
jgi:hypothetical protein